MAQVDVYKLNAQLKTVVVGVRLALTSIKLALTSTYAWSLAWLFSIGVMSVTSALVAPRHVKARSSVETVLVFPFMAPHLNRRSLKSQTSLMRRAIARRRRIKTRSARSVRRALKRSRFKLESLRAPRTALADVALVCRRARVSRALATRMALGTDRKPALLKGVWFFCGDERRRIERFELPFEGKLSNRVWRLFAERAEEALQRLVPESGLSVDLTSNLGSGAAVSPLSSAPLQRPSTSRPPPLRPLPIPPIRDVLLDVPARLEPPEDIARRPQDPEGDRREISLKAASESQSGLELWAGGRAFVRDFLYSATPDSGLLSGGVRYSSGLLPGWGISARARPFAQSLRPALRQFTLSAELERYTFNSIYIIADPFGKDGEERLQSSLTRWGAKITLGHGLLSKSRLHIVGVEFKYRGLSMPIEDNPYYRGVTYHMIELGIMSALSLVPQALWFDLSGSFMPWVGLGDTVSEVGAESQNFGASAQMGLRYRTEAGLSLAISLGLDFVFYDMEGEGRNNRFGDEARDQMLTLKLDLGWMKQPQGMSASQELRETEVVN